MPLHLWIREPSYSMITTMIYYVPSQVKIGRYLNTKVGPALLGMNQPAHISRRDKIRENDSEIYVLLLRTNGSISNRLTFYFIF